MGGTLNATTEQAANDARRAFDADHNRKILSHGGDYVGNGEPMFQSPLNAASIKESEPPIVDPLQDEGAAQPFRSEPEPVYAQPTQPPVQTLADLDQQNRSAAPPAPHDEARAAVQAALETTPAVAPQAAAPIPAQSFAGLPPLPPLPDFSTLPPLPQEPAFNAPPDPAAGLPPENLEEILPQAPAPAPAPVPSDPGQFKIPGQS